MVIQVLQYADDTIILMRDDLVAAVRLKVLLEQFAGHD
jgi:hypothetical protein